MIPIRDTIPSQRTAWVVRLLVAANIAGFVLELQQGQQIEAFLYRFGVVPAYWGINELEQIVQWPQLLLTLITSQFLHGSLLHLGSNMLYLWIFGDNVEDRLGHSRFLFFYLFSGAIAALVELLVNSQTTLPLIGASGSIAGVLGAYFVLFPFARVLTLIPLFITWQSIEVPAFVFLGFWFALQWLQGLVTIGQISGASGGIAWWAHVGGFVSGLILVGLFHPRRRGS